MTIDPEKIVPKGGYLLVEVYEPPKETSAGLEVFNSDALYATPVMAAITRTGEKSEYKVGDKVLFRRYALDELKLPTAEGEQKIFLLDEKEIIAHISN